MADLPPSPSASLYNKLAIKTSEFDESVLKLLGFVHDMQMLDYV
jgi:hypothetical protein